MSTTAGRYDASLIHEFADRLYARADAIQALYALGGVVLGAAAGYGVRGVLGAAVGAVVLGAIGGFIGSNQAFWLRLQAQMALCQAQIEENTRPLRASGAGGRLPFLSAPALLPAAPVAPAAVTVATPVVSTNGDPETPTPAPDSAAFRRRRPSWDQ